MLLIGVTPLRAKTVVTRCHATKQTKTYLAPLRQKRRDIPMPISTLRSSPDTMPTPSEPDPLVQSFIDRWHDSGGHERGTAQQFILELCQLLGVETPRPTPPETNCYIQ